MIQRIQTIYLLLAAVVAMISGYSVINDVLAGIPIIDEAIFFVSSSLSTVTILQFKNRMRQFVINRFNLLIQIFLIGLIIYELLVVKDGVIFSVAIFNFAPMVIVLLLTLANKAIQKDEKLVKSADRIR